MMRKLLFGAFLALHVSFLTMAQTTKPLRIEIEPKSKSDDYYIAPAGKNGIIVFNETDDKGSQKGEKFWSFSLYDVSFNEVWTKSASVPKKLEFVKFYNDKQGLFILLADRSGGYDGSNATYSGNFTIVNIDFASGKISTASNKLPYNTSISDFKVVNNVAFFGGKVMPTSGQIMGKTCLLYCTCCIPVFFGGLEFKTPATLGTMDVFNNKASFPAITYKGNSAVTSIDVEEDKNRVSVFIANRESKNKINGYIHEYDKNGNLINKLKLDPGVNEINTGTISSFGENDKIIIGTYALPIQANTFGAKMARAMAPTSGGTSQGVYISKFENGNQKFIKYYSFTDFKNFFNYLPNTQVNKFEKTSKKKKEQGRDLKLNYNILVHQLVERNGQYFFVGECYYPEYHTEYYTDYVNGRPVTRTRQVFDGWRYTHAIVATFDKDGNLLWDASFPIWNILTFNLKERVKILPQGNNTVLVYSYGGYLTSMVVTGNSLTEGKERTAIDTGVEGDQVKADYSSDIIFWYENYFIAWGYQKIKNKESDDVKKKRRVFYFNKIAFK